MDKSSDRLLMNLCQRVFWGLSRRCSVITYHCIGSMLLQRRGEPHVLYSEFHYFLRHVVLRKCQPTQRQGALSETPWTDREPAPRRLWLVGWTALITKHALLFSDVQHLKKQTPNHFLVNLFLLYKYFSWILNLSRPQHLLPTVV